MTLDDTGTSTRRNRMVRHWQPIACMAMVTTAAMGLRSSPPPSSAAKKNLHRKQPRLRAAPTDLTQPKARAIHTPALPLPQLQPRLGQPLAGLTPKQRRRFAAGKVLFRKVFREEDGLGPNYNLHSCSGCHSNPVGGSGTLSVTMFGQVMLGQFDPLRHLGGPLLQSESHLPDCAEEVPPEANVMAERITSSVLGGGLIEAIPDEAIRRKADQPPRGVSGRVNLVHAVEDPASHNKRVGRFGFKAQLGTILSFSAAAAVNELGLTNRFFPDEPPPNGSRSVERSCDTVADPELVPDRHGIDYLDRVTDFQRYLAAPAQTPRSGMAGEKVFQRIGCADCHVPSFTTSHDAALEPALRGRIIFPYSDFLLHDMGALGDGIAQGVATGAEMKTTPLWGFRIRFPIMHDGRLAGATVTERATRAIMQHDGEAAASIAEYVDLEPHDVHKLVAFLDSLGRVEFDLDGDNDVDRLDFVSFLGCFTGINPNRYTPDDRCSISDPDQDGDLDLVDFALFQRAYTGQQYGTTLVVP